MTPSLRDLVTILYHPRETIRRILDSGRPRWTWEVIVLASVCSSYIDPDIRRITTVSLTTKIALAVFGIIINAAAWVALASLFAWAGTIVGRRLDGEGTVRDMRTAVAWTLVPQVWSIVFRIPGAIYLSRFAGTERDVRILFEFVRQGGCSVVVVLLTIQILLYGLMLYVGSNAIGEALRFSSWRGLATIAITSVIPIVIGVAAFIATRA